MKRVSSLLIALGLFIVSNAQNTAETQIRNLEQNEVQAILVKDTSTLRKLWSPDLMTNSSANRVNIGRQVDFVKSGAFDYTAYSRTIEHVRTEGEVVITMGFESVTPKGNLDKPGTPQQRRVTSVWMKQNGIWRLIARQTGDLCQ